MNTGMETAERVARLRRKKHKLVWIQHGLCRLLEGATAAGIILFLCGWF